MLDGSAQPRTWGPMTTPPMIRTTTWGTRSRASRPTTRGASAETSATTKRLLSALVRSSADTGVSSTGGLVPHVALGQKPVAVLRAPAAPRVRLHRDHVAEHRIDDPPGGLDRLLLGEQPALPGQRGADQPVVGAHAGSRLLGERQVFGLGDPGHTRLLAVEGEADLGLRPDSEAQHVGLG